MEFLVLLCLIFTTVLILCCLIYFINDKSFKRIRPLKTQIINSHESTDVKLMFYEQIRINDVYKYRLKSLNKNLYDKKLIDYAYRYINKTLNQELRDLISCTGGFSSRLNSSILQDHSAQAEEKRDRLLQDVLDSKDTENFRRSHGYTN